ncbi:MAG: hypothetical protein WCX08_02060 [Candidatus Buchananbacteria bacterium]
MFELLKRSKFNISAGSLAVLAIVYLSGNFGAGEFLNNHIAFGYGGGGGGSTILEPITAINNWLVIPDQYRNGKLIRRSGNDILLELEIPPLAVKDYTIFEVNYVGLDSTNQPCDSQNAIIGGKIFNLSAKDRNNNLSGNFLQNLNVNLTIANLPADLTSLGIYFLNNNSQWVLGQKAIFDVDNKTIFAVNDIGTFAVINAPGLPPILETYDRCHYGPEVLGVKEYANGSYLRTCDGQLYQIENQKAVDVSKKIPLSQRTYNDSAVFDVDFNVIYSYTQNPVFGLKTFRDGQLLRTCDWRIYRVENQKFRYIGTHQELIDNYEGQKINNVDFWTIDNYLGLNYTGSHPDTTGKVLGVKQYVVGTIVRTADGKVYIIEDQTIRHVATLAASENYYAGQKIYNIDNESFNYYQNQGVNSGEKVLGVKKYANGTLLRTRDWKVYLVQNDKLLYLDTIAGPDNQLNGKRIYDVDYGVLAQYTDKKVSVPGQVLGVKKYADGALIRTPNRKIYIIENQSPRQITGLAELNRYAGKTIYNISDDDLAAYFSPLPTIETGGQVLGVKKYADGSLLKTPDWKIYEVAGQTLKHIATVPSPDNAYQGKKIFNVDYETISSYQIVN